MRHLLNCLLLTLLLTAASCARYENEKIYIPDEKYTLAKVIYDTTNSLDLTEKALRDNPQWNRGEINEAVYRLRKQYRLE